MLNFTSLSLYQLNFIFFQGEELSAAHESLSELLAKLKTEPPCKEILETLPLKTVTPCLSERLKSFGRSLMNRTEKEDEVVLTGCLLNEPTLQVILYFSRPRARS